MKLINFYFAILILIPWNTTSQTTSHGKIKYYKAIIKMDNGEKQKGFLYNVMDSTIYLVADRADLPHVSNNPHLMIKVPANRIEKLKIRRSSSVATGAVIGAATGIVIGVLVDRGVQETLDPLDPFGFDEASKALGKGGYVIGIPLLTTSGALLGSIPKNKFEINGSTKRFNMYYFAMKKYSYMAFRQIQKLN